MFAGVKEITPLNLVRMGLARANSSTMVIRASYKSNWEMYSDGEVKGLYDRVMKHLVGQEIFGEFLAVEEIFGREIAMELTKKGELVQPGHVRVEAARKRKAMEVEGDGEEDRRAGKRRAREESEESESSDDEVEII
jgi:hypothetical protein